MTEISYNRAPVFGDELSAIAEVIERRRLGGDGSSTHRCEDWLKARLGCHKAYLVHSCTAALEMAMMLLDLGPGHEVIMPSFTFSSTANAVVLRGATPVFADVVPETMNVDVNAIEKLVTSATKAIIPVHYAGRVPDMDRINAIASARGLTVVEDAAQSLGSTYKGQPAGTHSSLSTISFHESKNVISGEGGALVVNDARFAERAAVIREKGTNRAAFVEGLVDKYTWVDYGSSYLPSELVAAYLAHQLEKTDLITQSRLETWQLYRSLLEPAVEEFGLGLPAPIDPISIPNGHIFHILLPSAGQRPSFIAGMRSLGVQCVFHYVPLHSSPAGLRYGSAPFGCPVAEDAAARLVRLPLYYGMAGDDVVRVCAAVKYMLGAVAE